MMFIPSWIVELLFWINVLTHIGKGYECECSSEDVLTGQEQLVDILDAAWIRVLNNGDYYNLIKDIPAFLNQADCLPVIETAPFPDINDLKCLPLRIMSKELIRVGTVPSDFNPLPFPLPGEDPGYDTTTTLLQNDEIRVLLELIIDQINLNYGINITIEQPEFAPFGISLTNELNNGTMDILDQVNALGGNNDDQRRRKSRLFTCSMFTSGQYIIIKNNNINNVNTIEDIWNLGDVAKLCTGQLSAQTTRAYFPDAQVDSFFRLNGGDINQCIIGIAIDEYDGFVTVFPDISDTEFDFSANGLDINDFNIFDLGIVTATPYWVAKDITYDVICPQQDSDSSSDD